MGLVHFDLTKFRESFRFGVIKYAVVMLQRSANALIKRVGRQDDAVSMNHAFYHAIAPACSTYLIGNLPQVSADSGFTLHGFAHDPRPAISLGRHGSSGSVRDGAS